MSPWTFLRRLFAPRRPPGAPPLPEPRLETAEEGFLPELVAKIADGMGVNKVDDPAFFSAIDALVEQGRARLAAEWLEKFVGVVPDGERRDTLRARLITLLADQGQIAQALPHLEALVRSPAHAARAHFLLGEHHQRAGNTHSALSHFEAVLALDVEYPNARGRVRLLREGQASHADLRGSLEETLAGTRARMDGARYQILGELGRGATAAVYLARDVELARRVAIKLLYPHLSAQGQATHRARFFTEARLCSALRHPHIVAILDLDEDAKRIVMELAAGGTLRARLSRGPLTLAAALAIHRDVLFALAAAHRLGIVHRDLTPANLLFRREGSDDDVMLADFGVAHLSAAQAQDPELRALGTLTYMAPEERRGGELDGRVDVYAAGVILYETLFGAPPWDRQTTLLGVREATDLLPPARLAAFVPPDLGTALHRHLVALGEPDPSARPTSEEALASARRLAEQVQILDELARFQKERDEILGSR